MANKAFVREHQELSDLEQNLDKLKNKWYFSALDNRLGFYSVQLAEESQKYTKFLTAHGSWVWCVLPTGLALSPSQYHMRIEKAVHSEVLRSDSGEILWEAENFVQMKSSPLEGVVCYLDDIVVGSPKYATREESVRQHFLLLEKVISRLHFHGVNISYSKCEFLLPNYFGWDGKCQKVRLPLILSE